jgi:hypothetical protein
MAWVAPIIAGLGALGGVFGSKQKQQQSGFQNQQGGSVTNFGTTSGTTTGSTVTPNINPLAAGGYQAISDKYMDLLNKDPNLTGYQAEQTEQINRQSDIQKQQLRENLAARGITGPAAETAIANAEAQRFGSTINLSNKIPLLARQLMENTMGNAGGFYHGIPVGQTTAGTTTSTTGGTTGQNQWGSTQQGGTVTTGVNPLSGLFGGAGNILALLSGMGMLGGGGSGTQQGPPNSWYGG